MFVRLRQGGEHVRRLGTAYPAVAIWCLLGPGAVACGSESSSVPGVPFGNGGSVQVVTSGQGGESPGTAGAGGSGPKSAGGAAPMLELPKGGAPGGGAGGSNGGMSAGGRTVTENCAMSKASATDIMTVRPADIIFAIDNSGSMDEETQFVQTNMNAFSQQISASGIDVHVILIASDTGMNSMCIDAPLGSGACPNDSKLPSYVHVPTRVGSHDALTRIIDSFPMWKEHLRPEATKAFVVVTDDDATAPSVSSAQAFTQQVSTLDPTLFARWTFNGVYCFTDCRPQAAAVGQVYIDLVASTMGVGGDLCLQNFQPVFDQLAKQIITTSGSTISCEWELPATPPGQSFSRELVKVDRTTSTGTTPLAAVATEADCSAGGWYFDSLLNPTKILACASTCMEMQNQSGGKIDVSFGCEAVGGCVPSNASTISSAMLSSCAWDIPMPPQGQIIDYKSVNVRYTSASGFASNLGNVATQADCDKVQNGWYYDAAVNPTKIIACPQTCTGVQTGGANAKIEVLFGCETLPAKVR